MIIEKIKKFDHRFPLNCLENREFYILALLSFFILYKDGAC